MGLDYRFANEWLDKLKTAWQNKDAEAAAKLFINTTFYQETPFTRPFTTFSEITEEWQHILNQHIAQIDFKILAIDNETLIVEWILQDDEHSYDGIYEIKFDQNRDCRYFKSWEMEERKR